MNACSLNHQRYTVIVYYILTFNMHAIIRNYVVWRGNWSSHV